MAEIDGHVIHPHITSAIVESAVRRRLSTLDNPGFCVGCGAEVDGVEPDARGYECESCGEALVYGADDLFMVMP